jgi:hypothetical protein
MILVSVIWALVLAAFVAAVCSAWLMDKARDIKDVALGVCMLLASLSTGALAVGLVQFL